MRIVQIVHIDDDPFYRLLVEDVLTEMGGSVVQAGDLASGWGRVMAADRVLVLCDLCLPDGHGIDFVRRLRAAGRRDTIVLLTGVLEPETEQVALAAGADRVMEKALTLEALEAQMAGLSDLASQAPGLTI